MNVIPVTLPDGAAVRLSPGSHNELQKAIIEEFGPRFAPGAVVVYLGDTAKKHVVLADEVLARHGITITEHDKLPDVVLLSERDEWIYFVEAVTSHGPVTPLRKANLEDMVAGGDLSPVFVSAFLNRDDFRRWITDIAWETEVWLASDPDHMIHFNGDKFMGPYGEHDSGTSK